MEERAFLSSPCQVHTNLGHLSCHSLTRATRVAGGSTAAVRVKVFVSSLPTFVVSFFATEPKRSAHGLKLLRQHSVDA